MTTRRRPEPKLLAVLDFYKALFEELDPEKLRSKFLHSLLVLQNVERGSIWVKKEGSYVCVEAMGPQSELVQGVAIEAERPSIVGWVIEHGEMTVAEAGKDSRHYAAIEDEVDQKSTLILCYPLILKSGEVYGAVQIIDTSAEGNHLNLDQEYLKLLQAQVAIGTMALSNSLAFTDQLRENVKLKRTLNEIRREAPIIGQSPAFLKTLKSVREYSRTDFPVLITGESGTGKELVAHEIHRLSRRRDKSFLVQNCSAIPETLLESELFGYKKGAFTGALHDKPGLFEDAAGGTVFLDEIGDMPLSLQARILRVIQNNEIKPLGGTASKRVDVRILSATNKDLRQAIAGNEFREDLYYRLNVLPLHMPALRERPEDIVLLLDYFIRRESLRLETRERSFSPQAMERLAAHPWPGNIREMENLIKYLLTTVHGDVIEVDDLPSHIVQEAALPPPPPAQESTPTADKTAFPEPALGPGGYTWDELERSYVLSLLEKNKWNISRAAKESGVNRSTFDSRMKKLGIRKS